MLRSAVSRLSRANNLLKTPPAQLLVKSLSERSEIGMYENRLVKVTARSAYGFIPGLVISQGLLNYAVSFEGLQVLPTIIIESALCFLLAAVIGIALRKIPVLSFFTI